MKKLILFLILVATILLNLRPCFAEPIYINEDQTRYIDLEFFFPTSFKLVPGEIAYLPAVLSNTGTETVTFKVWLDVPWQMRCTPGVQFVAGGSTVVTRYQPEGLRHAGGHQEGTMFPRQQNWSHLSNVSINPGESLTFDLITMFIGSTTPLNSRWVYRTTAWLEFGDPIYAGFTTRDGLPPSIHDIIVDVRAASSAEVGPLQQLPLYNWYSEPWCETIDIDIKPGNDSCSVNPRSKGKIPVAIMSTMDFYAPVEVDSEYLTFGATGIEASLAYCDEIPEDVNGDLLDDLVCHFYTQEAGFQCGDVEGFLKGLTVDSPHMGLEGSDSVRIVPCR